MIIKEKTHFLFTFYGVNFEKNHDQVLKLIFQTVIKNLFIISFKSGNQ